MVVSWSCSDRDVRVPHGVPLSSAIASPLSGFIHLSSSELILIDALSPVILVASACLAPAPHERLSISALVTRAFDLSVEHSCAVRAHRPQSFCTHLHGAARSRRLDSRAALAHISRSIASYTLCCERPTLAATLIYRSPTARVVPIPPEGLGPFALRWCASPQLD